MNDIQFSSVTQSCPTLCDPMNHSTPGLPVHHQLPESTQTHVHCIGDAIQPSHPLSSPSPLVLNLSQHQDLLKWVSSSHQAAKVLEFQCQHQSFQWIFRIYSLIKRASLVAQNHPDPLVHEEWPFLYFTLSYNIFILRPSVASTIRSSIMMTWAGWG